MKTQDMMSFAAVLTMAGCAYHQDNASDERQRTYTRAVANLSPASNSEVKGTVTFIREGSTTLVEATLSGLTPGLHGFHIHEKGDCSAPDAASAGGHFNPTGMPHAGPEAHDRHVGDFGNIEADASGNARFSKIFSNLQFEGAASIIGKAVIVHAKADDLKTQPSGDAGGRVACGVINLQPPVGQKYATRIESRLHE
jgi:superoxide dismutase, Cu-Zn family